jgi:hypothetical protein
MPDEAAMQSSIVMMGKKEENAFLPKGLFPSPSMANFFHCQVRGISV